VILSEVFERFVKESPLSVMGRGLMERLLNRQRLDEWFAATAEKQYTRELLFSSLFDIMSQVVCGTHRSVHAAYQASAEDIGVSITSLYNKLNALEPETSAALVRYAAGQAAPLIEELGGTLAEPLPGFRVKLLDGNCIEASEHRLKALRSQRAGALPGKSLVVYDPRLGLPIDVFPCEDGHAQERSLLHGVLPTVAAHDLWIADRNFCTRGFLSGLQHREAYFIIRQHGNLPWEAIGPGLRPAGDSPTGAISQQRVHVIDEQGEALILRRICVRLKRKTRDGDTHIYLLTNLPESIASAQQIAEFYRGRWTIETAFQHLTQHLNSEINTLGYPRAALFGFCIALVAYIIMATIKAAMRGVWGAQTIEQTVSGYYIADEISGTYRGMLIAIPEPEWQIFRTLTQSELVQLLRKLAASINLRRYKKHPRGPKKPSPKRVSNKNQPHVSTARLIANLKNNNSAP
jgi:hypothetical protein